MGCSTPCVRNNRLPGEKVETVDCCWGKIVGGFCLRRGCSGHSYIVASRFGRTDKRAEG